MQKVHDVCRHRRVPILLNHNRRRRPLRVERDDPVFHSDIRDHPFDIIGDVDKLFPLFGMDGDRLPHGSIIGEEGMRLMNRIQRQLEYGITEDNLQINEIQNRLNRAKSILNKLKNNQQLQTNFQNELQQLDNLYNQAEIHFERKDYEIANEYLNYILQQINKLSNEGSQQTK